MPKSYEDEIRDILKGMDRFPGEVAPRRRRRQWSLPTMPRLGHLDARRVMGGALLLMLFSWIIGSPLGRGFPALAVFAGYISFASLVLFVVALVMLIRGGGLGSSYGRGIGREPRWRGQVIDLPRRGGLGWMIPRWYRNLVARFSGGVSRRPPSGPRKRDSFQW
ncbi:MAG: hypothetical protein HY332_04975 [Chloroflexi bacterium]|nr:hypothetical protein [Chloroflexota bacterium]